MNIKDIKKIKKIIDRQKRTNACVFIYNIPKEDQEKIVNALTKEGVDAYTRMMLEYRLGSHLNIKNFKLNMLPALQGKTVIISELFTVKPSYNQVLIDFYKYKVPLLMLINGGTTMQELRELAAYRQVLTIEQDFNNL
jgi:hypothetical protein